MKNFWTFGNLVILPIAVVRYVVGDYICGADVTDTASGLIQSPNHPLPYPPNAHCTWTITTNFGLGIEVDVQYLDNKERGGVCYDTLDVYRLMTASGERSEHVWNLCGNSVADLSQDVRRFEPSTDNSNTTAIQIDFRSDATTQLAGFSLYFRAICNGTQSGSRGAVTSPRFPNAYPNSATCATELRTEADSRVKITFLHFDLEAADDNGLCAFDYVVVASHGRDGSKKHGRKMCGFQIPPSVITDSNVVTITFVSDDRVPGTGFQLSWEQVNEPESTTSVQTTALASTTNLPKTTRAATSHSTTSLAETILPEIILVETTGETKQVTTENKERTNTTIQEGITSPEPNAETTTLVIPTTMRASVDTVSPQNTAFQTSQGYPYEVTVPAVIGINTAKSQGEWWVHLMYVLGALLAAFLAAVALAGYRRQKQVKRDNRDEGHVTFTATVFENEVDELSDTRTRENTYVEILYNTPDQVYSQVGQPTPLQEEQNSLKRAPEKEPLMERCSFNGVADPHQNKPDDQTGTSCGEPYSLAEGTCDVSRENGNQNQVTDMTSQRAGKSKTGSKSGRGNWKPFPAPIKPERRLTRNKLHGSESETSAPTCGDEVVGTSVYQVPVPFDVRYEGESEGVYEECGDHDSCFIDDATTCVSSPTDGSGCDCVIDLSLKVPISPQSIDFSNVGGDWYNMPADTTTELRHASTCAHDNCAGEYCEMGSVRSASSEQLRPSAARMQAAPSQYVAMQLSAADDVFSPYDLADDHPEA